MGSFRYKVYGLVIDSEISLPELIMEKNKAPDVFIKLGMVPDQLEKPLGSGVLYEAGEDDFIFRLDNVARYRVREGRFITIQANKNAAPEEVRLFLLGSVMGALLHQRGMLALHGSAVVKNNRATIITGVSSAGKSSLAAGLYEKGYAILSDDITVINTGDASIPAVSPGIPHLKLWKDVLIYMNEGKSLERIRPRMEKYKKPVKQIGPDTNTKLCRIIVLATKNTPGFTMEEIRGAKKFSLLRSHTYR
ncbi:MAG TPA: hypothetical protein ENO11_04945, partial [Desulfobacteraceae bacterium]|nr:hypothetical protein [Desulfobacteraceae bacterium]